MRTATFSPALRHTRPFGNDIRDADISGGNVHLRFSWPMEEQQAAQKRPRLASADEAQPDESINNGHGLTEHSDKFVPMYGNYRGYYHKRTGASGLDQRLKLVPRELVKGKVSLADQGTMQACESWARLNEGFVCGLKRVLDVGCNTGLVTIQIAQDMHPYRVTGVDLDEDLIEGAERQGERAVGFVRCKQEDIL